MTDQALVRPPAGEAEIEQYAALCGQAFMAPMEDSRRYVASVGPENCRLLFDGSELAAGLAMIEMGQYFGGREIPCCGIAAVAVAAHARGRGRARLLMEKALSEARAAGVPLSSLYPATRRLYRRCGYELAGSRFIARVPTADLPRRSRTGRVRPFKDEEQERVHPAYEGTARGINGHVRRNAFLWRHIRRRSGIDCEGYLFERGGAVEGYVYYYIERGGDVHRRTMSITDFVAATPEALGGLLAFIGDHRSLIKEVTLPTGPAEPWLALLEEQAYTLSHDVKWMIRILDVEKALSRRGYPAGVRADLRLRLRDELFAENAGEFVLRVEDGTGEVERVSTGGRGSALTMGINAFAALYAGFYSATALRSIGWLDGEADAIASADAIFAGPAPWMRDGF
jgi:predicted acetyltransferase